VIFGSRGAARQQPKIVTFQNDFDVFDPPHRLAQKALRAA
jgi:hypothetical protein